MAIVKRRVLWIGLAVLLLVPIGIVLFEHFRGRRELAKVLAELQPELDPERFAPPPVPPASNALDRVSEAVLRLGLSGDLSPPRMQMLASGRMIPGTWLESWEGVSSGAIMNWETVRAWLGQRADIIEDLDRAMDAPFRQPVVDYGDPKALMQHLQHFKRAAEVYAILAADAARRGDMKAAVASLRRVRRAERDLSTQPLLIDQLVRIACGAIATSRAWDVAHAHEWPEEELALLQTTLEGGDIAADMVHALKGERAFTHLGRDRIGAEMLEFLEVGGFSVVEIRLPFDFGPWGDAVVNLIERGVGSIRHWGARACLPVWTFGWGDLAHANYLRRAGVQIERAEETARAGSLAVLGERPVTPEGPVTLRSMIRDLQGPDDLIWRSMARALRAETERAMVAAGIALHRYQLRNGAYPEELAQLVPEFLDAPPVDRMDGKPLRYRRTDDGRLHLWSAGDNCRDDGGDFQMKWAGGNWWIGPDARLPNAATKEEFARWREAAQRASGNGARPVRATGR